MERLEPEPSDDEAWPEQEDRYTDVPPVDATDVSKDPARLACEFTVGAGIPVCAMSSTTTTTTRTQHLQYILTY